MSQKLTLNKKEIVSKFLTPISKITEKCILTAQQNHISALTNVDDGSIILYAKYITSTQLPEGTVLQLNVPDVKKLGRMLECIDTDTIEIDSNSNNLAYESNTLKFKYHLLEEGVMQKAVISVDKITKLTFDTSFTLTNAKLDGILKASSFTTQSNKLYFYTKDNKMYGELTDRTMQNIDSVDFSIADSFTGTEIKQVIPINLDTLRMLNGTQTDILVKINTQIKVLMFEINNNNVMLKYIISALSK